MPEAEVLGGRYEVVRTVSCGPRASVLQALDRVHDRSVALKVYPVDQLGRDALMSEARLLMSIAPHPALPVVRGDFFTEDASRYVVVLNWVEGTDLEQLLEEQGDPGFPLRQVVDDLAQAADALDHLHGHQPAIVHGDVKPSNLVRTQTGRIVLVDFDIAGAESEAARVGTVGYVAPEVAAGEKPGPAADVFGLAATAFTLLNGGSPAVTTGTYPGLAPWVQAEVARALRAALSVDPKRRPRSAGRLVETLRAAATAQRPSGVVALLATEVADAGQLWMQDADDMRTAMARLRDVRDEVVNDAGGQVIASMNEGDRTMAVFGEASSAATAALHLHDRLAREPLPPGMRLRLRAGIAVGEATLIDGIYTGAVVDQVVRLRSVAEPGTTVTAEPTAELLVGLVGASMSIVPLTGVSDPDLPTGTALFVLAAPGRHTSRDLAARPGRRVPLAAPETAPTMTVSRRAAVSAAAQQPSPLIAAIVAGAALIYLTVLSSELGWRAPALAVVVVGLCACAVTFWSAYTGDRARQRRSIEDQTERAEAAVRAKVAERDRLDLRDRLARGFADLDTDGDSGSGGLVLERLGEEADAVMELLRRGHQRLVAGLASLVPGLAEEAYRHGMSALSDALQLLEFADGAHRRRVEHDLEDLEERIARSSYADDRERSRDEQRRTSQQQLVSRQEEARQRARDLMFEAERCVAALAETRLELASVSADEIQIDVAVVVQTLQDTIGRVRDVQEELRRLGY